MIIFLYLATLVITVFCTMGILGIANPKKDWEIWGLIIFIIIISAVNYWLGVFIDSGSG